MRVRNFFQSLTPAHIRMHHFANDGTRTNDGDLDYYVVKASRRVMRKRSHLRPAFNLKHSYSVGIAEGFIYEGIFGQGGEINLRVVVLRDEIDRVLKNCHHAEAE